MYTSEMASGGILGSLKRFSETVLAILQNRMELVAVELREEKTRAIGTVIWGAMMIFFSFMAVVAIMLTLVFVFWEQKVIVMGGFCAFFIIGAAVSFFLVKGKLKTAPFSETINQLKKDREWLQSRN